MTHVLTKEEETKKLKERSKKIDKEKLPKRPFFMDEDLKRTRGLPSPGQYAPKGLGKILGNIEMKLDRVSFLDEAIIDK